MVQSKGSWEMAQSGGSWNMAQLVGSWDMVQSVGSWDMAHLVGYLDTGTFCRILRHGTVSRILRHGSLGRIWTAEMWHNNAKLSSSQELLSISSFSPIKSTKIHTSGVNIFYTNFLQAFINIWQLSCVFKIFLCLKYLHKSARKF